MIKKHINLLVIRTCWWDWVHVAIQYMYNKKKYWPS